MVAEQEDAMVRLEATSQHAFFRQSEEYAHKQQALFDEFDGAVKDKDAAVCPLKKELVNQKEQALTELEQARLDAERVASVPRPVFADGLSTQPSATPAEKRRYKPLQRFQGKREATPWSSLYADVIAPKLRL